MSRNVVVAVSSLQDAAYRDRGIGQHVTSILRAYPRNTAAPRLVALADPTLPRLRDEIASLFDDIIFQAYAEANGSGWFIHPSPMTNNVVRLGQIASRACRRRRAAIIYDFIPHDMADTYLRTPAARLEYYTRLAWLRNYDAFFPISKFTADRTSELLGVSPKRMTVTGVAVRSSVVPDDSVAPPDQDSHFLVVAGGDPRKNVEAPIAAHAGSARLQHARISLFIAGAYTEADRLSLTSNYTSFGGDATLLRFLPHLTDRELSSMYRTAIATLAPSRMEGFSIPIIEASANGCPVLAADCAAQKELIGDPEALFAPDDILRLRLLAERQAFDPHARAALVARQRTIWEPFTERSVASRFWDRLLEEPLQPPNVVLGALPNVALLSPLPPQPTGVADHTYSTLFALKHRATISVYSSADRPQAPVGVRVERLSPLAYLLGKHDAVIAVLGNSHFHFEIFRLLLNYGGACVLHDSRMLGFYAALEGFHRAREVAAAELERPVEDSELHGWLGDETRLPIGFFSEILNAAKPAFVHSRGSQRYIADLYGKDVGYLPLAVQRCPTREISGLSSRARARAKLHVADDAVIIASFGHVIRSKEPQELVWALALLREWGFAVMLAFVGDAEAAEQRRLEKLAAELELSALVRFTGPVSESDWRTWLLGADVAVQIRGVGKGSVSGALLDALSFGIPAVANEDLADAIDAPASCLRVPNALSAVIIAERLAELAEAGPLAPRDEPMRSSFIAEHSIGNYANRLLAGLGLA